MFRSPCSGCGFPTPLEHASAAYQYTDLLSRRGYIFPGGHVYLVRGLQQRWPHQHGCPLNGIPPTHHGARGGRHTYSNPARRSRRAGSCTRAHTRSSLCARATPKYACCACAGSLSYPRRARGHTKFKATPFGSPPCPHTVVPRRPWAHNWKLRDHGNRCAGHTDHCVLPCRDFHLLGVRCGWDYRHHSFVAGIVQQPDAGTARQPPGLPRPAPSPVSPSRCVSVRGAKQPHFTQPTRQQPHESGGHTLLHME